MGEHSIEWNLYATALWLHATDTASVRDVIRTVFRDTNGCEFQYQTRSFSIRLSLSVFCVAFEKPLQKPTKTEREREREHSETEQKYPISEFDA